LKIDVVRETPIPQPPPAIKEVTLTLSGREASFLLLRVIDHPVAGISGVLSDLRALLLQAGVKPS
jgi:hypothetical protein